MITSVDGLSNVNAPMNNKGVQYNNYQYKTSPIPYDTVSFSSNSSAQAPEKKKSLFAPLAKLATVGAVGVGLLAFARKSFLSGVNVNNFDFAKANIVDKAKYIAAVAGDYLIAFEKGIKMSGFAKDMFSKIG